MMLKRLTRDLTMAEAARAQSGARVDFLLVADMVERGAKVLDVGCGDGELLRILTERRDGGGRGVENFRASGHECGAQGVAGLPRDAATDLVDHSDDSVR